jgi:hypothetical protein
MARLSGRAPIGSSVRRLRARAPAFAVPSPARPFLIYAVGMSDRLTSTTKDTSNVERQEALSALTPAGMIESYGSAFGSIRGRSRWRRFGAIAIALLILSPFLVMAIGYSMMLIRAL